MRPRFRPSVITVHKCASAFFEDQSPIKQLLDLQTPRLKGIPRKATFFNLIRSNTKHIELTPILEFDIGDLSVFHSHDSQRTHLSPEEHYSEILEIRESTDYEMLKVYQEKFKLGEIILVLLRIKVAISELSSLIVYFSAFESIVFVVILLNTIVLALEGENYNFYDLDIFFLAFYTVEFFLKIFTLGLYSTSKTYFRDKWNMLDFFVLVTAWVDFIWSSRVNLQALRVFRVLRPLKSISSLQGLRVIFLALLSSFKALISALWLLSLLILIFAIAGMQLWSGLLKYRCMDLETGVINDSEICGSFQCSQGYECVKGLNNPNYGITNYDNFLFAILTVYQCITLEGWTDTMLISEKAFSSFTYFFYIPLVFVGALIFLNLIMAVIKVAFSKAILEIKPKQKQTVLEREVDTNDLRIYLSKSFESSSEVNNNSFHSWSPEKESIQSSRLAKNSVRKLLKIKKSNSLAEENFPEDFDNSGANLFASLDKSNEDLRNSTFEISKLKTPKKFKSERSLSNISEISILLSRIESSLKIRKNALEIIQSGNKLERIKLEIKCYQINSTSHQDIEKESALKALPIVLKSLKYRFSYSDSNENCISALTIWENKKAKIIEKFNGNLSEFLIFSKLSEKYDIESAFELTHFPVSILCKQQAETDEITMNIVGNWSGCDVNSYRLHAEVENINSMKYKIWRSGLFGHIQRLTAPIGKFTESQLFTVIITLSVMANVLVLSMDYYGISAFFQNILSTVNIFFTYVFLTEMMLKIVGLGVKKYCQDLMNYFDGIIVILSMAELFFLTGKSTISVFRVFRVLRVIKLFRYLRAMSHLIHIITRSASRYLYLGLLLLLSMMIYSLMAMQIFKNSVQTTDNGNFSNFFNSFITIFQVLSIENWQKILYTTMNSQAGYSSCIFLISCIILGNYIILNLFLAILLENFSEDDNDEHLKNRSKGLFSNHSERMRKRREHTLKMIERLNSDSEEDCEEEKPNSKTQCELEDPGKSFYVFSVTNKFRAACIYISTSTIFEKSIIALIVLSSVKLAVDTYADSFQSYTSYSDKIDTAIISVFIGEFLIKSTAKGFILGKSAYLHEKWNYIDFIVVLASVIDLAMTEINISDIKVVRLLRTLRPLRYISHNNSMKIVLVALLQSIAAIFNVVIIQFIVTLMFAVLGVSLLSGKLYQCSNPLIGSQIACLANGFTWDLLYPNYDNIFNALATFFILSSQENWPDIMNSAVSGTSPGYGQIQNYNPSISVLFIVYIMISSFVFMNLFVGVVYEKFNEARKNETSLAASILTKEQMIWIEMQKLILKSKPKLIVSVKTKNKFRLCMRAIEKKKIFKTGIVLAIVLNMIQMAIQYDGASSEYVLVLDTLNLFFTSIFIFEFLIKIIAQGYCSYYSSWSNCFDFFVVFFSTLDLILTYALNSQLSLLRSGPQLIRIIRVFRISKLVRLFKTLETLRKMIDIIWYSLPAIANVLALLLLIFFIYAIIGVNLFQNVSTGKIINEYNNFADFKMAMLILFRCSTGEDWNAIMFDCGVQQSLIISQIYFMSFITLVMFIMLNLFIMVLIQSYEDCEKNPERVSDIFHKEVKKIKVYWNLHSNCRQKMRMSFNGVLLLLKDLKEFGINTYSDHWELLSVAKVMDLDVDSQGYVHYNRFLYAYLRKKYLKKWFGEHFKKILTNEEKKTKIILNKISTEVYKNTPANSQIKKTTSIGELIFQKIYLKSLLRSWRVYTSLKRANRLNRPSPVITPLNTESLDSIIL